MARTYRQLDLDQRRTLFRLVEAWQPVGEIAEQLGRHPSTIYRSPQQIAGRLKREPTDGGASVCHETIYRHVYGPEGQRDGLYRHLPKARRRRGSRYGRRPRSASIPREHWIENRPAEVGDRQVFGH